MLDLWLHDLFCPINKKIHTPPYCRVAAAAVSAAAAVATAAVAAAAVL